MSGSIGTVACDLPPGKGNPRNSEGSFVTRADGRILFAYSRFRGEKGHDDSPSDIAALISDDEGRTWNDAGLLVSSDQHGARNIMSVSLLKMRNNDIGLFYCVRAGANDLRSHLRRSSDDGHTWSASMPCIAPPGYYVVNNDRVVMLSTGRLIIPAAFHRNGFNSDDSTNRVRFDSRGVDVFFLSDDDGFTWTEADTKCALPFHRHSRSGLQEPGIIELTNGVLWAYARTDLSVQYEMFSFDCGQSWTSPEPSRFTSPQSPLSMKRIPAATVSAPGQRSGPGRIVSVWNPIPNYNGRSVREQGMWTGGRTPLVLATSADDGATWSDPVVLEDEPGHCYCYTAIHFTDSAMLLAYGAGGVPDGGCLSRLRIRRISLTELPA